MTVDFTHICLLIAVIPQIEELALAVAVPVLRVVSQFLARLVDVLSIYIPFVLPCYVFMRLLPGTWSRPYLPSEYCIFLLIY